MTNRHKAYLALLGNAAIWGLALPLAKRGFAETGPMTFLFYRYLFATLAGLPIFLMLSRKARFGRQDIPHILGIAVFSNLLAHWLLYTGLAHTSALEASLLTTLSPILVALGGAIFLKEIITNREKIGTGIAFFGSLFVALEPLWFNSRQLNFSHTLGNLMALGYCFSWAVAALWMKKVANRYHPFSLFYLIFVFNTLAFLPLAIGENPRLFQENYFLLPHAFTASLYMGTLGSLAAFFLYQYGQKFIEASEATVFAYLTNLFSAPIAILWLKEIPSGIFLAGSAAVVLGVVLAESHRPIKLFTKLRQH
jgi:drug/metabolite transporter (DMT)-like permease